MNLVEVNGVIETNLSYDVWLEDFMGWIESRGEYFGGGTHQINESENAKETV
jgi:hypothetical protein